MRIKTIPEEEQQSLIEAYWIMLGECESKAEINNDLILKNWVSQWYKLWNRVVGDNKKPRWEK